MIDRYSILIIDDEHIVGERLASFLVKDGYRVETFTDPQSALDRLQEKTFDIVVTDIRMGEIDGIQILETVLEQSKRTRVIMISGYATLGLAKESLKKGAFDFIAKPFKLKEIRKTIKNASKSLKTEDQHTAASALAQTKNDSSDH